jgi:hypothetical protein
MLGLWVLSNFNNAKPKDQGTGERPNLLDAGF